MQFFKRSSCIVNKAEMQFDYKNIGVIEDSDFVTVVNDELTAAIALWDKWKDSPEDCLRLASHGKRLVGFGNHDADFKCCAALDKLHVVPTQVAPGVLSAT